MSLNIDDLKNKIVYRSTYRGTKEMDILLKSFVRNIINQLDNEDLEKLLAFLNIDDENLYKYKQGLMTDFEIKENKITKLFKNYVIKK